MIQKCSLTSFVAPLATNYLYLLSNCSDKATDIHHFCGFCSLGFWQMNVFKELTFCAKNRMRNAIVVLASRAASCWKLASETEWAHWEEERSRVKTKTWKINVTSHVNVYRSFFFFSKTQQEIALLAWLLNVQFAYGKLEKSRFLYLKLSNTSFFQLCSIFLSTPNTIHALC